MSTKSITNYQDWKAKGIHVGDTGKNLDQGCELQMGLNRQWGLPEDWESSALFTLALTPLWLLGVFLFALSSEVTKSLMTLTISNAVLCLSMFHSKWSTMPFENLDFCIFWVCPFFKLELIADHTPWQHCLHLSTKSSPFLDRSWRSNSNVIVNDRVKLSDTSEKAHWLCCVGYILILWIVTEKKFTVCLPESSVFSFSLLNFLWES